MKKILALSAILFICASATFTAQHPLIGQWRFREVIGGTVFEDFVTISAVNAETKRVSAHLTGLPNYRLTGYCQGNTAFLMDNTLEGYANGYYFTFQGMVSHKKHLGVCLIDHNLDARRHSLSITKLSNSTFSNEIIPLNYLVNQVALKIQAQSRERMMLKPLR